MVVFLQKTLNTNIYKSSWWWVELGHHASQSRLNLTWLVLLVLTHGHFLWLDAGFTRKLELRQCQVQHQRWHCTGRLNFIGLPVSLSAELWPNHLDISRWIKSPILAKHFNPDSPSESSESMPKISKDFVQNLRNPLPDQPFSDHQVFRTHHHRAAEVKLDEPRTGNALKLGERGEVWLSK